MEKGSWTIVDEPVVGGIYKDVFETGKKFECVDKLWSEKTRRHVYDMKCIKTGVVGRYQQEGWKFVK